MKYLLTLCLFILACNSPEPLNAITTVGTSSLKPGDWLDYDGNKLTVRSPCDDLLDNNYGKSQDQFTPSLLLQGIVYDGLGIPHAGRTWSTTWGNGDIESIYAGQPGPFQEYFDFTEQGGIITSGSTSVNDHYDPTYDPDNDDSIVYDGTDVLIYRDGKWIKKCPWRSTMQDLLSLVKEPELSDTTLRWKYSDYTDDHCLYDNYNEKLCLQQERRALDRKMREIEEKERKEEQRKTLIRDAEQLLKECQ